MSSLKFLTWNVRGLRNRIKRTAVLTFLKSQHADIITLAETHVTGHLQSSLKKPWIGWAYHATHTSYSRGMLILVAKRVPFKLVLLQTDQQGRYVLIHATINGSPILILSCYVPPPYNSLVIKEGLAFMTQYPSIPAVWMGDFNMTLTPALDRMGTLDPPLDPPTHTRLYRILADFAIVDTWRHKHPHTKVFSCFSATHNTMSRIDFILLCKSLTPKLGDVGFAPRILSDHAPYWITLQLLKASSLAVEPILADGSDGPG